MAEVISVDDDIKKAAFEAAFLIGFDSL